ncbi:putative cytochrome P450 [Nemania sp. FL0031]|nr:putative cytochrome P450 [Nemania sp. FL0031]
MTTRENSAIWLVVVVASSLVVALFFRHWLDHPGAIKSPPSLCDPIPYIFNTLQFLFDNDRFTKRVLSALKKSNVVKFHLGSKEVYLLSGAQNVQALFTSRKLSYEEIFITKAFPKFWRLNKDEVKRFANDKSGPNRVPLPGTESTPSEQRYWAARHQVYHGFLGRSRQFQPTIDEFSNQFMKMVEGSRFPLGEWTTVSVVSLCRNEVASCAVSALFGQHILSLNSGFLDAFWDFDSVFFNLILGLPRWVYSRPFDAHDRHLAMIDKYLNQALEKFAWDGPDAQALWEPLFGARICRELVKWLIEAGFQREALTGALGSLLFAQNSNSIPTATWMLMELFKDTSLFQAVQEEIETARGGSGSRRLDLDTLMTLPLLTSVFTETLRLRMSLNIIRTLESPITIGGYEIPKGSYLQAPTMAAHYDEDTWGQPGHPASEFWAGRHIKYVESNDSGKPGLQRVFATPGHPNTFFPFGGGTPICPGRHFAKAEIFSMVSIVVDRFDVEFIAWTELDGSPSDRPARNDARYSAAGSSPPDRDMLVRWKRRW